MGKFGMDAEVQEIISVFDGIGCIYFYLKEWEFPHDILVEEVKQENLMNWSPLCIERIKDALDEGYHAYLYIYFLGKNDKKYDVSNDSIAV